jgi:hypothetical protein
MEMPAAGRLEFCSSGTLSERHMILTNIPVRITPLEKKPRFSGERGLNNSRD